MLALGLVLIILAALVVLVVLFGANNAAITFDLTLFDIGTTPLGVFLLGAATLLVLVTGLGLMQRGTRRGLQHRRDRKELDRLHAAESRTAPDRPDPERPEPHDRHAGQTPRDPRTEDRHPPV